MKRWNDDDDNKSDIIACFFEDKAENVYDDLTEEVKDNYGELCRVLKQKSGACGNERMLFKLIPE